MEGAQDGTTAQDRITARQRTTARQERAGAQRERTTAPDPATAPAPDAAPDPAPPVTAPRPAGPDLELLVHGVGGTTPEKMLGDCRTVRVTGDDTAAVFRRAEDAVTAEATGDSTATPDRATDTGTPGGGPVQEAYVWGNLTSGSASRVLWLLLLPFMVVNLAHWMRPSVRDAHTRPVRLYGVLVRLAALSLTVLLVAAACEVALDLVAWQCAGVTACSGRHTWLALLSPAASGHGWWSEPGRRLALAALVPVLLTALLWYLSHRTWSAYESHQPMDRSPEPDAGTGALARPGFWYGRRFGARLRAAHTAAALLTVAAGLTIPALSHDHRPGGPAALALLGPLLAAALLIAAVLVAGVVCRRGRTEDHLDRKTDHLLVRGLPLGALGLLLLAALYAGWSRPHWVSAGRLPGAPAFAGLMLAQGVLTVLLAAVANELYRHHPDPRAAMRGLGGPAVALLACALGGVASGGVAQRVADWLDGTRSSLAGPPVILTWQASAIPPLLLVLLVTAAVLGRRTARLARAERARVREEHPGEGEDPHRTRAIARTRALAALTDRTPLLLGIGSVATLVLGATALAGALATGKPPTGAAEGAAEPFRAAAGIAQALGSWLVGAGLLLFATWGRRAYKDAAARRTIGILWDVGTFWPRAAHPFAPPCYAERAVPDLTWRTATWTERTGGRLVLSGHSQGSVLVAAAAWQLTPAVRERVALLTYGSPLERLYGRWFPAHFGAEALTALHRDVGCWRNLFRRTDPIGGPLRLPGEPRVDHAPLPDPRAYGRTPEQPLPAPIRGHFDYPEDPVFPRERALLLARLHPDVPAQRPDPGPAA